MNYRGKANHTLTRRDFLITSAGAGAGLVMLAAGCGGQQGGSTGAVSLLLSGGDSPQAKEYWDSAIKEFENNNSEININKSTIGWDAAHDEIFNQLRAGNAPDLIKVGSRWINEFASLQNGIASLDGRITPKIQGQYYSSVLDTVKSGGEIYGIPDLYSTKALIYRTDLIEKPPQTWEETVSTAQEVQKANPNVSGIGISADAHVSTVSQFSQFLYQAGGRVFDREGKVAINSENGVRALTYYVDFFRKHKLTPNPIEYNREELPTLFKNNQIAMMFIGPWGGEPSMGLKPDNDKVPYASTLLPAGEVRATELVTDALVISDGATNPEAAWQFLEFIATPKQQAKKDRIMGAVPLMPKETQVEPMFIKDPYWHTFVKMAEHGVPAPQPAIWQPFESIIVEMVQTAMLGKAKPEQAVEKAANQIKSESLEPRDAE